MKTILILSLFMAGVWATGYTPATTTAKPPPPPPPKVTREEAALYCHQHKDHSNSVISANKNLEDARPCSCRCSLCEGRYVGTWQYGNFCAKPYLSPENCLELIPQCVCRNPNQYQNGKLAQVRHFPSVTAARAAICKISIPIADRDNHACGDHTYMQVVPYEYCKDVPTHSVWIDLPKTYTCPPGKTLD